MTSGNNSEKCRLCDFCLCRLLCRLFRFVAIILSFLLFLILVPVVLLFIFPIYIWRFLVIKFASCCGTDLGRALTTRSAIFAVDGIYEQPLCCNVARFISDGRCDILKLVNLIDEEWLQAKFENRQLKYPELKQYVTTWMGYLFWKNDEEFEVTNHVKLYECKKPGHLIPMSEVNDLWSELSMKPFEKKRSPWEIVVIPLLLDSEQQENAKSVIIFRWHHSLSDGFSILNLLTSVASINTNTIAKARGDSNGKNCCTSLCGNICAAFTAPYLILTTLFASADKNAWHLSQKKLTRYWHVAVGENIPIKMVHDIRMGFNVSFTSVILAAVAGAMKKMMVADQRVEKKKLPGSITCGIPFPLPNHPQKLRNHWAMCTISLPVEEENPCKRLQIIDRNIQEIKQNYLPAISYKFMRFIGGLPASSIRSLATNNLTTLVCSIMPGPPEPLTNFMEQDVLDAMYINGCGPGRNGFSFSAFSCSGNMKFAATVDSAFFPDDSVAQELTVGIMEELSFLKHSVKSRISV